VKSLMLLWKEVALEYGRLCRVSTDRDFDRVTRRVKDEGVSFLTITLPTLSKGLERALEQGWSEPSLYPAFAGKGKVPHFLSGFFALVFDPFTGRLLDDPSTDAITAIRQLSLIFGKIELECAPFRVEKAFRNFIECEKEVRSYDVSTKASGKLDAFSDMSRLLFGPALRSLDFDVQQSRAVPKHGPGSTADRLLGNKKYEQVEWTRRLEQVFPSSDYLIPSARHFKRLDHITLLEPGSERPVRVVSVPKTLKTPRIIALEPCAMQYAQQGLRELIYDYLEADKISGDENIVRGMIHFTDQIPNREMAQRGSLSGDLATLDLSEASDRVSNQLVRAMFLRFPDIGEAVDACRSRSADVPGHGVIRLAKFASMGSALCFPIEAMVFLTIIFLGIQQELNRPVTRRDVKSLQGRVRVYGDDIIVPVEYTRAVIETLESFGLKVNSDKSFWIGRFRESCGKEYYGGDDVSIVRCRHMFPASTADATECISWVSLRNQFYMAGLWDTARYLDSVLEKKLRFFPTVGLLSPLLGRHSLLGYQSDKLHRDFQSPVSKGWMVDARPPVSLLDDLPALLKFFLKRGVEPSPDVKHLERYGRPLAVRIKLRYGPSF